MQETDDGMTLMEEHATVEFDPDVDESTVHQVLERLRLQILHSVAELPGHYIVVLIGGGDVFDMLQACNELVESGVALMATPGTTTTIKRAQIYPVSFLRPLQFQFDVAKIYQAWERLRIHSRDDLGIPLITHNDDITYGRSDVIIAIMDDGLPSQAAVPTEQARHPNFQGNVKGAAILGTGMQKVYRFFNFRHRARVGGAFIQMVPDNRNPEGSHGIHCTGVATALTNLNEPVAPPGATVAGVVGAIPNARVIGAIDSIGNNPMGNYHHFRAWEWLGGLDPRWIRSAAGLYDPLQVFPDIFGRGANPGPGAGIHSFSGTFGSVGSPVADIRSMHAVLSGISWLGRNRRGGFFFQAAGNSDSDINLNHMVSDHRRIIVVGASALDHNNMEIRTPYSAFHAAAPPAVPAYPAIANYYPKPEIMGGGVGGYNIGLEFCAPSHTHYQLVAGGNSLPFHDPPRNRGIFSTGLIDAVGLPAGVGNDSNVPGGNPAAALPGVMTLQAAVLAPNAPGGPFNTITVNRPAGAVVANIGDFLLIGDPAGGNATEAAEVIGRADNPGNSVLTLRESLRNAHPLPCNVHFGPPHYTDMFGGTSEATPLAAGIAGLVVSARPTLTNVEVREIMRETAIPIDLRQTYRGGPWRGTNPALGVPPLGPMPGTPANPLQDLVDANGLFVLNAPDSRLSAATLRGATVITVPAADRGLFRERQAILIGAETRLLGVAGLVLDVASVDGFFNGQTIRVGVSYSTYLSGVVPGTNDIRVGNTRGFRVNDVVMINGAAYTVLAIINSARMTLNVLPPAPPPPPWMVPPPPAGTWVYPLDPPIQVTLQRSEPCTVMNVAPAVAGPPAVPARITVNALTQVHPVGEIIQVEGTETTIVKALGPGPQDLTVEPLVNDHPIPAGTQTWVRGGLRPYYSPALGFGRVDAYAAVHAARLYDHNWRDLMIRNAVTDNGQVRYDIAVNPVDSPDLWIRNLAPTNPDEVLRRPPMGAITPAQYNTPGPHKNPITGGMRWIYARVRNRGTRQGLDAAIRFYICAKQRASAAPAIADFNQTVLKTFDGAGQPITSTDWTLAANGATEGTQYLGERFLYAEPGLPRGIDGGQVYITHLEWPAAATPPAGAPRMRFYLLAEITPHDGVVRDIMGAALPDNLVIGENNNITYKEISFATINIRNGAGGAIIPQPHTFDVARTGVATQYNIRVEIADTIGYFLADHISVELSIRPAPPVAGGAPGAVRETVVYREAAGVWGFNPGFAGVAWADLNPPQVNPGGGNAAGVSTNVTLDGWIRIDAAADQIEIKVIIRNESGGVLTDHSIAAAIRPEPVDYTDPDVRGLPGLGLFAFADMTGLPEQDEDATFGPVSAEVFRATSSFSPTSDVPIYAPMSGTLLVQRVSDGAGGYDASIVNVIIKPSERTSGDTPSLEYVVFRGVRLDSFFTVNGSQLETRSAEGASELIKMIHKHQTARRAAFLANTTFATANPGLEPSTTIGVDLFGWIPTVGDSTRLDEYFNGKERTVQLIHVPAGMEIGEFAAGDDAGVEMIAEGGVFVPTLGFARKRSHSIDFGEAPYDTLEGLAAKHAREEVLSFIDPAAYYGLHSSYGARKRNGADSDTLDAAGIYNDVVSRFATRNTVYLDIRNENNYSLSYYPDSVQVRLGAASADLIEDEYGTLGWPIRIIQRASEQIAEGDAERLYVALPTADNKKPVIHASAGTMASRGSSKTASDSELYIENEEWSREVALHTPQVDDGSGDMLDVATLVRLHYGRRVDSTRVWDANSPVPKFQYYTDNLFGPIGVEDPWELPSGTKTRWVNLRDRRFIDGATTAPALDFGSVAERGIAFQEGQVVLFNVSLDIKTDGGETFSSLPAIGSSNGGFSVQASFAHAAGMLSRMKIITQEIKDTPVGGGGEVTVPLVRLEPEKKPLSANSFMMLGVSNDQYTLLKNAAATLSPYHHRNLVLEKDTGPGVGGVFTDANNGTQYHRYTVKVRGLDSFGVSTDAPPSQTIKVYSMDGLSFVSSAFVMPELVLPNCTPDHEETRSLQKEPWEMIKADDTIKVDVEGFDAAVAAITEPRATAKADLQNLVRTYGKRIIDHARVTSKTIRDDRPLYWARLRMMVALKKHWYSIANKIDCDALAAELEDISRGRGPITHSGIDFSAAAGRKKILVTGFDPFELNDDIETSNPSGAIALALHGEQLQSPSNVLGYVQTALFPVRYRDFDAGVIEAFFKKYLYDEPVDMIVTLSMNGPSAYYDIERFASRFRNPELLDNNDQHGASPIGAGASWDEFYETELPSQAMMSGVNLTLPPGQVVYYDQSYKSTGGSGGSQEVKHPTVTGAPNFKTDAPGVTLASIEGSALRGSGGTYLSNEIFYRVARLREEPPAGITSPSSVPTGHLHIPGIPQAGPGKTIEDVLTQTKDLLARGLDGL